MRFIICHRHTQVSHTDHTCHRQNASPLRVKTRSKRHYQGSDHGLKENAIKSKSVVIATSSTVPICALSFLNTSTRELACAFREAGFRAEVHDK